MLCDEVRKQLQESTNCDVQNLLRALQKMGLRPFALQTMEHLLCEYRKLYRAEELLDARPRQQGKCAAPPRRTPPEQYMDLWKHVKRYICPGFAAVLLGHAANGNPLLGPDMRHKLAPLSLKEKEKEKWIELRDLSNIHRKEYHNLTRALPNAFGITKPQLEQMLVEIGEDRDVEAVQAELRKRDYLCEHAVADQVRKAIVQAAIAAKLNRERDKIFREHKARCASELRLTGRVRHGSHVGLWLGSTK